MCITKKGIVSGIVASLVMIILSFLFSMIIPGQTEWYLKMFPGMANMLGLITTYSSYFVIGIVMGVAYDMVNKALPWKAWKKGFVFGIGAWLLAGTMWPIMMISFAPAYLWIAEFISGFILYSAAGLTIYFVGNKMK